MLKNWLAHPLTRGLNIDDPRTTQLRKRIIREKAFLRKIYQEWYHAIAEALPAGSAPVVELGSGGGFLGDWIPGLITSEISHFPDLNAVVDAQQLPFAAGSLRGIVMTNVLHHLPQPRRFFMEAGRTIFPGGVITMYEPWVSPWSKFISVRMHYEPFLPEAGWELPKGGPLSEANGALPWIIFERDRDRFEQEFPEWIIKEIKPGMPFRYLLSGGVTLRDLMPGISFDSFRWLEQRIQAWMRHLAMFAQITLVRR